MKMEKQSKKKTISSNQNTVTTGRPLVVPWQESEAELLALYQQESHPRLRMRLKALWMLRQGKLIREVSCHIETSYRSIQLWLAWYRQGGLAEVLRRVPGHNAPGSRPFLSKSQLEILKTRAERGDFQSINEILDWVQTEWGVTFKYKGICSLFRRRGIVMSKRNDQCQGRELALENYLCQTR